VGVLDAVQRQEQIEPVLPAAGRRPLILADEGGNPRGEPWWDSVPAMDVSRREDLRTGTPGFGLAQGTPASLAVVPGRPRKSLAARGHFFTGWMP
jgi:hypothetical protein